MTALLASVRNPSEARAVAAGGATWIDLKEPAAGALGAVERAVVTAVAREFGATHRISATIGDCWETPGLIAPRVAAMTAAGAHYVKVGAYAAPPSPQLLSALAAACRDAAARVIVVCFAERPPSAADLDLLAATGIAGLMLDTAEKGGPRLPELLTGPELASFVARARELGLLSGLAGRLRAEDVPAVARAAPDYLGFRGALCEGGARSAAVDPRRVRTLVRQLAEANSVAMPETRNHGMA